MGRPRYTFVVGVIECLYQQKRYHISSLRRGDLRRLEMWGRVGEEGERVEKRDAEGKRRGGRGSERKREEEDWR